MYKAREKLESSRALNKILICWHKNKGAFARINLVSTIE